MSSNKTACLRALTRDWGTEQDVSLYLSRCQVDTSDALVQRVWHRVSELRSNIGFVVDFGAGDGRFAKPGRFQQYVGYEIDPTRFGSPHLKENAVLLQECAFSAEITCADLAIGNPPYVRNQDLPNGWRELAARVVSQKTAVQPSGLANAWQYFFLLSLASTNDSGLVALVIPYEWVSRPSSAKLRAYIRSMRWSVSVYRLRDDAFDRVLTTSSITIIDKSARTNEWRFFNEAEDSSFHELHSETVHEGGVLPYRRVNRLTSVHAKRGLSPGTQRVFTLTEGERARYGLEIGRDVVPCVTSLKHVPADLSDLNTDAFRRIYRDQARRCWLIQVRNHPSRALTRYLDAIPEELRDTSTCTSRETWWKFTMPGIPKILLASGFVGDRTKCVVNTVGAVAVGSVCGIYGVPHRSRTEYARYLRELSISDRIVSHANGLRKLEINQLNTLLEEKAARTYA